MLSELCLGWVVDVRNGGLGVWAALHRMGISGLLQLTTCASAIILVIYLLELLRRCRGNAVALM
jgi:hypothetical protein